MQFLFSLFTLLPVLLFSAKAPSLAQMRLEEKVGQLLLVHFRGESANEDASLLIQKLHVGGFIYYQWANGLHNPQQVLHLSAGLQKIAQKQPLAIPLFIGVDQEGGAVVRLKEGFTTFPSNQILGLTKDPSVAEVAARITGEELRSVGINMNFAPVIDISSRSCNARMASRAFSTHKEEVAAFGKQALEGYAKARVIACLKHFPGIGNADTDPHCGLPQLHRSKEELVREELYPFIALSPIAPTLMTAHLLIPALDPNRCATLSPILLTDLLRKQMGYEGVIISDSLVMKGLLKNCSSIEEAAILALDAGCDLLILGGKQLLEHEGDLELSTKDMLRIFDALIEAVKEGRLSEKRIDASVQRILKLKEKYGLFDEGSHS